MATVGEGRPDKVPDESKKERGEAAVEAVQEVFPYADKRVASSRDITDCSFDAADDVGATAVVYRPLEDNRLMKVLSEDISLKLVTEADRPVVTLA